MRRATDRVGHRRRCARASAAVLATAASVVSVHALGQTSSTWAADVGTAGGSWSNTANWAGGVVPDNGGTASFITLPTFTTAPLAIIQDQPTVTLSGISFDGFITYLLRPPTGNITNNITLTGPATINTIAPSINTLNTTVFGQQASISFAGSAGLTKTGPGTLTLWQTNTYTGGTTVNGGIVVARQFGDAVFGNPTGGITLSDGTIRVTTSAWTSSRSINFAGAGTIEATTTGTTTFNGAVSGSGTLNKAGSRGLTLTASNPFSGAVNVLAGSLSLSGNGSLQQIPSLVSRDTLTLDDSTINLADRINDAAPITLQGSNFNLNGSATGIISETIGDTTFSRGTTVVTVAPNGGAAALHAGAVSRDTGAAVFFRGDNLGNTPPVPSVARVDFTTPPTLVGGGGGASFSTNISIIPWAYGNLSSTGSLNSATSSFVTYGATGIRPLDVNTEYATSLPSANATDNVRLTANQTLAGPATVNSLTMANTSAIAIDGAPGSTLTISSGGLLALGTGTISVPLDFGSAQAMVIAPASLTFAGAISGSGGLSKQGVGIAVFANSASSYTGATIIGGGTANYIGNVPSGATSPFGNSTSAIVLAPAGTGTGGGTARLMYAGTAGTTATFDRDLLVTGRVALNNNATLPGFGAGSGAAVVMNGNITLDNSAMSLIGAGNGATLTINGSISGSGVINDQGGTNSIRLNGNNTFDGGVEMGSSSTWQVGSNSAFGTGMIKTVQLSGGPTIIAAGGPRIVPNEAVSFSFSSTYWTIGGSNDITFTGSINLSGSYTHNITNTGLTTYAGVLHTGGFTKAGAGTLVLSGSNIYTGSTTVSSGVLRVTNGDALGSAKAPTIVNSGATLEITNAALSSEPVTVSGAGVGGNGAIRSTSGTNSFGTITIPGDATIGVDADTLSVAAVVASPVAPGSTSLQKIGTGQLAAVNGYQLGSGGTLNVNAGTAAVSNSRSTQKTSRIGGLTIAAGAAMDLADNDLIIDYTGSTSPLPAVQALAQIGYAGGSWNGTGLTSNAAAAQASTAHRTALGIAEASDIFTSFPAMFSGQSVDNTAVLVRYTYSGDANLDGTVDTLDFNNLAANFGGTAKRWDQADFNYDGVVDTLDFNALAANFSQQLPEVDAAVGSLVPEPCGLLVLAIAGTSLIGSRRGRRRRP